MYGAPHTIEGLAVEILVLAFAEVLVHEEWSFAELRSLALVCKRWLSIIKATPMLWAVAKYDENSSFAI